VPFAGPLLTLAAYLLGSVCFGLVLAARQGIDLRAQGSGNVGATNVSRVLGARAGRITLALDGLKGLMPVLAGRLLLGPDDPWTAAAGVVAVVGHLFPVWHGFRGGKGAATAAGVLIAAVPLAGAAAALVFAALKKATRRASVGSIGAAGTGCVVALALEGPSAFGAMATALLVLVVAAHGANIRRLLRGEEPPS